MSRPAQVVTVSPADHDQLLALVKKGTHKSRKITRARALLLMGAGKSRLVVQAGAGISATQYFRIKQRYLAGGLPQALEERPRSGQPAKVTAELEAKIMSLACSPAPAGAARWTLALLQEAVVSRQYVAAISDESVRKVLKKANSNPG